MSVASSCHSSPFEDPPLSESPKIRTQRKSTVNSLSLLAEEETPSSKYCANVPGNSSVRQSEPTMLRSSLRSSKMYSGPTESLAASSRRGLEVIDSHQQSVSKSSVAFSFEHLMLKPSPAVDKANASVQTLSKASVDGPSSPFICVSCRQKGEKVSNEVEDSLKTWIVPSNKEGTGSDAAQDGKKELEKVCNEQAAKIEELNQLVEQLKQEKEKHIVSQNSQEMKGEKSCADGDNPEPEVIKETCEIAAKRELCNNSFDLR